LNRQFTTTLVADARVIAENAERMAQEIRRTACAVEGIVDELKILWEAVSPLVNRLRSTVTGPPA
jgi:hypothetical protein